MLTTWEYSAKTEAERLIQTAHQIIIGFYKTNNFLVLPYLSTIKNVNIVTFPDLAYNTIPRFWEQAKKTEVTTLPLVVDPQLTVAVSKLIEDANLSTPKFEKTKNLWQKIETEVIKELYKVLPTKDGQIKKIIIHPTSFGTSSSFNFINQQGVIIIYLREDQGVHAIVESILTSLTRADIYSKLDGLWAESEIITDFLLTQTSLATVLQKYESLSAYTPTLKGTRVKEQAKILQESENFYKKLGIPSFDKPFSCVNDSPRVFDKPIENITNSEKNLMTTLISNQNQVVDFDTLGTAMFKSEDDFSLYAISKTIQRLRDKLEASGISGSYIQTLRGKGYLLKN